MFTLFKKKEKKEIFAFASGVVKSLTKVPDEAFSKGLLGPGIAIVPSDKTIVSPINGEITMLFPTKHALGIRREDGLEVLLHIGVDTVTLKGEGFTALVEEGRTVKVGEPLIIVDLPLLKEKQIVIDTMCIVTNPTQASIDLE
ncbi:MAG: PTS glucose transporter subunit IIA [Coprobacillaceae bacterium]